jgi:putative endonuclease
MLGKNKKIGTWGEKLAENYYKKFGYELICRNWSRRGGEIDLIFLKDKEIVFVEVKTRTTNVCGWAEDAVTPVKKQKISKLIDQYLMLNQEYQGNFPRFDILVVELISAAPKFIHYENVILN